MEYIKVKDLFTISKGKKVEALEYKNDEAIRYIQIDDLRNDDNLKYCENSTKYVIANKEDIIIAWDGANAGTIGFGLEGAIGSTLAVLRKQNNEMNSEFCGLFLRSKSIYLREKCTGATIPHIQKSVLENIKIPKFDIDMQIKIVKIINKAQELIDKRKEQIEQLDELVKSRFIEMFGNNNTIFEKWENAIVEEVSEVSVGVVIKPSEYYTEENNGIKTFRSLNVGEMFVKDKDWVYFTKEGNEKNKKSILKEGQVLIVRSGYPGTACVVSKEYEGCNAIDIIIATPDDSKINSTYMCAFTNFPHGKNQILNGQAGAGQKHFNVGSYKKLKIALPPIELQNKFSDFVKQVDKLKFEIEKSLKELEDNFNSLIQKAFKGELF